MKCDYISPEGNEAKKRATAVDGITPGDLRMIMDSFRCHSVAEWKVQPDNGVAVLACSNHVGLLLTRTRHTITPIGGYVTITLNWPTVTATSPQVIYYPLR